MADGPGRPIEAAYGPIAAAEQQDLGVPARVDIGEWIPDCGRRARVRSKVSRAGCPVGVAPQLVQPP